MQQYERAFRDNAIDTAVLSELTADDLKDLGVTLVGHRRKLLAGIAALGGKAGAAGERASAAQAAERRQLTVVFCDLVGSTELSARLDPEDLREVIAGYHRAVADVVRSFDGFIAKYMGDGILLYFGYPRAHEDEAERAVRAGLAVIEAVGRLDVASVRLQARVGIATGLVVVGDLIGEGSAREQSVVGETPNLAARLQAFAEPDAVVIAAGTRRLVGNLFDYRDLGAVEVKGMAGPVPAWQVLSPSSLASRFEALRGSALTPLIGRDEEIELLMGRWARAKDGNGQIVLVSGEAGIGKSRITEALQERLAGEHYTRLRYFGSPHHADSPLHPVIVQLERAAGFAREDTPGTKLDKLEILLSQAGENSPDSAALIADLLALPNDGRYPSLPPDPRRQREDTFGSLVRQLEGLAREQPVLVIFEDVQWVDSTSLELLGIILERVPRLPVLFVLTFRPEFQPHWTGDAHVTLLTLGRLSQRETEALVEQVAGGKSLPAEILVQIAERADGIPLYTEELTKALLEGGHLREQDGRYLFTGPSPSFGIPSSLHASLLARLDRLAPVRGVAQIGAALGREFSYEKLAAVAGRPDDELRDALDQLTGAGLLFRRGILLRATFMFKHALIQDAAYSTLLRGQRQALHARIGNMLREQFPEIAVTEPETLAHHYTQAGLVDIAINYWRKAGERALRRSAMVEAVQHLTHGIELTRSLPATPARDRRELDLHLALGRFIRIVKGMAAPETLQVFMRARRLLDDGATVTEQMTVFYGLWGVHYVRAEHAEAREVAEQCLDLAARHLNDDGAGVLANYIMGDTLWATGTFVAARYHLERTLALTAAAGAGSAVARDLQNHEINALSYLSWVLWPLGYPAQAIAAARQSVQRARETGHVPLIAFVGWVDAFLAAAFGADRDRPEARFDEVVTYCAEHGVKAYELWTRFSQGIAVARGGDAERGISVMHGAMAELETINAVILRPLYLGHLAAAHASLDQAGLGVSLIDEAISALEKTGERLFEAELYRLQGQLWITLDKTDEAETALLRALTVARGQQARMWELRAAVSLARLWRDQGKDAQARELIAAIYGWFTEGFDTADLKEAKTLLEELAA
jgi:class 3 adenylate cyclase/tetratricopeptide (TPR) repeat protein